MLGWHLHIHKQTNGEKQPANNKSFKGIKLASWNTNIKGIDWLENLVNVGKAISLGGDGYPSIYTFTVETLLLQIENEVPKFQDKTIIDHTSFDNCNPEEWLLVKAWDRS